MKLLPFASLALLGILLAAVALFGPLRVVVSDSMAPALRPGDVLWLQPVRGAIEPGMIVSYRLNEKLITHRVVRVEGSMLVTQGDNNDEPDPWKVPVSSVAGTPAFQIPGLGYLIMFLKQPLGWILCVLAPAVYLIAGEIKEIREKLGVANGQRTEG